MSGVAAWPDPERILSLDRADRRIRIMHRDRDLTLG